MSTLGETTQMFLQNAHCAFHVGGIVGRGENSLASPLFVAPHEVHLNWIGGA
jgi:hypothetical protein